MAEEENSVQVAVRMRIFNQRERDAKATRIIRMTREDVGSKTFITNPTTGDEKEFKFDYSFNSHANTPEVGPYASQDTVFDDLGRPVMASALEGRNVCLFAYGQTGAGKSFSMLGKSDPPSMQGIIPRTCREIFRVIDKEVGNPLVEASVSIQVVEIYCEVVNDLLADRKTWPPNGHKPKMTKDGFTVDTISKPCLNYRDIEAAFEFADRNRSVGSHALNPESSRAHTIYQINYQKRSKASVDATQCETITTRVNLVDLAGSERMESAGTSGQMLKEGNAINLSLTSLGNCIKALSENKRAQFRESKLTLLLQASMTNGKVVMIAALSPASICYDESVSTLRFAERIKMVKIRTKKNVTRDPVAEIKKEMEEMRKRMQDEIDELRHNQGSGGGGGGGGGDSGANQEELEALRQALDEQREQERQLKEDLESRVRMMQESDLERQQRAKDIEEKWKSALGGAATGSKEELTVPYLLNLNEDPRLSGSLVYPIDGPRVLAGRSNKEAPPKFEFNGMGIVKNHCTFCYRETDKMLTIDPTQGAACYVNGVPVKGPEELRHNFRLWLGNNYAFRVVIPGGEASGDATTPDYLAAEAEMSRHAAKSDAQGGLNHQLSEALKKVEQANIIATDLSRDAIFSPKITKSRYTGEDMVVVHVNLGGSTLHWPWDTFNSRLMDMVKQWQEWQRCTANEVAYEVPPPAEDPFVDNDFQLIGEADVWLRSLENMIELDVNPAILNISGTSEGNLGVAVLPLDRNGGEGPWDDDSDLDPFVESAEDLRNKEIKFAIRVNRLTFEVDLQHGGGIKYRELFVRYRINYKDLEESYTQTPTFPVSDVRVDVGHAHTFTRFVDDDMYSLIVKEKIIFQVWGKPDTTVSMAKGVGTVALPEGWKRVTAYQAPDGNLHLQPPS